MIGITLLVWRCLLYIFVFKKVIVCSRKPFIVLHCRQCPRFSVWMIIWIFCSLVMMCISLVSTVTFPKSETAMLSTSLLHPGTVLWGHGTLRTLKRLFLRSPRLFVYLWQPRTWPSPCPRKGRTMQFGLTRPGDHDNDHVEQDNDFDDHTW